MSIYRGTVTITQTWEDVEVEADSDEDAELKMDKLTIAELDANCNPSEDRQVDDIEKVDEEDE